MSDDGTRTDLRTDRPTPARMYDYYLGGKDNFAVDREAAEQVLAVVPELRDVARENRAFLGRAVQYLVNEVGIRQFIDIGTGLPTQGNVHEIAQAVDPGSRVVYVDNDPIVRAHANALLAYDGSTTVVEADMRDPRTILDHPEMRRLIDFDRPVAVLFIAVLHFITDAEGPKDIVTTFRDAVPAGSYLALSHITFPERDREEAETAANVYKNRATSPAIFRTHQQVHDLFDGFELVDPGLVQVPEWRPTHLDVAQNTDNIWILGGVGRKL